MNAVSSQVAVQLVYESAGKADLLYGVFDGRQSTESVDLQLTCHPSHSLITFAFRSTEAIRLELDLDPYDWTDTVGMFRLFVERTADDLAPLSL